MQEEITQMATMSMMMGIMKNCFADCATDFNISTLASKEQNCIQNCAKRSALTYEVIAETQGQID